MEKTIIDFSSPDEQDRWELINDAVMGGISESRISITEQNTAIFQGTVSLENNGGFSSLRTNAGEFDLALYKGLMVRVKGDGKDYRLRLKMDTSFEGIAYQVHFSTEQDKWIIARLPFEAFTPVFRGQVIEDAPKLDLSGIQRIGFMIADKQAGIFRLEIQWIKSYS